MVTPPPGSVALVTGGARGLGVEISRQLAQAGLQVWLTARSLERAAAGAESMRGDGDVRAAQLDVSDPDSIDRLVQRLDRLDVLVNNAAIDYDTDSTAAAADLERVRRALDTNLFGPWQLTQALLPYLRRSDHPRIVNVSSEGGSLGEMGGGLPAYRTSKLALNGLTRMLAAELGPDGILVNSVCPGWTATDMGGGGRPVAEGARGVTWACLLDDDGPSGGFFRDGHRLAW